MAMGRNALWKAALILSTCEFDAEAIYLASPSPHGHAYSESA